MRIKLLVLLVWVALLAVACGGTTPPTTEEVVATVETAVEEVAPTTEAAAEDPTAEMAEEATAAPEATEEPTTTAGDGTMPMADPLAVSGDIVAAGSSTVFPLAEAVALRYSDEGFAGQVTIDSVGTGGGFERFCETGETDIANASRAINEEEVAACEVIGRTPIEFRVGTDALAVVVSTENDFVADLTLEQLALIFSTAENWSDVEASWPAEPIQRYIPGTDSGTYDYFTEEVFPDLEDGAANPQLEASGLNQSEDDNVLVQGVAGSPYAIGYFGYAYASENTDTLRPVMIEGVEPNAASVEANEYPLARPLFIYSDATILTEKPQVADFINFFLTYVNEEIDAVGYFPASDEALGGSACAFVAAVGE